MTASLDIAVLRLLKDRKRYERFNKSIPAGTLTAETKTLIGRIGEFFQETDAAELTFQEFWPFLRSRYPAWRPKDEAHWHALIQPIDKDNPAGLNDSVIRNLLTADLGTNALAAIEKWTVGGEIDLAQTLRGLVDSFDATLDRKVAQTRAELTFEDIIAGEATDAGLHWRLACLNDSMRPLVAGDFGIVAARVDVGKTSFLTSELSFMARQLYDRGDGHRPVLHINNEGVGSRIIRRYVQSALNLTVSQMVALGAAELQALYAAAVGHVDMIQVHDCHGWGTPEIEALIQKVNPGVVVFDMLDSVSFGGFAMHRGERTDQVLESLYQWARVQAVKRDFVCIATSQLSETAEGQRWPTQAQLKDSRTGKAGACDWIVTVGRDPAIPTARFIGCAKNKNKREGGKYSPECAVTFDLDRGRYTMPVEVDG